MNTSPLCLLVAILVAAPAKGEVKPVATLKGCGGVAVAYSQDGARIVTAGKQAARVWDGRTFAPVTGPMKHGGEIEHAALSADGRRVLTTGSDHVARVWDAGTGVGLARIDTGGEIHSAAISPDGTKLVTGGSLDLARVWDAASGKRLCELRVGALKFNPDKTPMPVTFLVFTPDGTEILALRSHEGGYLFDARTGQERVERSLDDDGPGFGSPSARPVSFTPDGKRAVSIGHSWLLVLWDTQTGRGICALDGRGGEDGAQMGSPQAVAVAADGQTFAGAGTSVGVWRLVNGRAQLVSDAFPSVDGPRDLVFSRDADRYLVAAEGTDSGVYDVRTGKQLLCIGREGQTPVVAYAPDGKHVAAAFRFDDHTTVWRVPE